MSPEKGPRLPALDPVVVAPNLPDGIAFMSIAGKTMKK
jgi:hypothetical protein